MKLHHSQLAPNPRRVRMFLAEKGIEIDLVPVSLMDHEHQRPEFLKLSPLAQIPVLEFDDGTTMTESIAINRYFEALQPEPNLFGRTPREIGDIEMWRRRMELSVMLPIAMAFRHAHPAMARLEDQCPDWAEVNRGRAERALRWLNDVLATREWLAAERFTMADIDGFIAVQFTKVPRIPIPEDAVHLRRWLDAIAARPSAAA